MTDTTDPTKPVAWVSKSTLELLWQEGHHVAVPTAVHKKPLKSGNGIPLYGPSLLSEYERVKAERDEAVAKLNDLISEDAAPTSLFEQYEARSEALEAENRRLREALGFYADRKNWDDGGFSNEDGPNVITLVPSSIDNDQGKKARAALEASR